jgi:hypothetical protein
MVRNHRAGPKTFVYTRVANLGDFSPKKGNLGIVLKNVLGIFRPTSGLMKFGLATLFSPYRYFSMKYREMNETTKHHF